MEKFKRAFSFRKRKDHVPEANKPHQWQEDEKKVREGTCSFQVRYLGCIEVFESRGIQVCEEAVNALKSRQHKSVWARMSMRKKKSKDKDQQSKSKYQRAVLYVSGDALRVVDEISKGLIVDQTIEKVSFCAPDRNHEKGFAYICRDGTTRRWMCHGFLAVKESGERMSHAVGCAFAVCLEKKQKREKEAVSVSFNDKGTSFTRMGSFRPATLTERMADPQSTIIPEPVSLPSEKASTSTSAVTAPSLPGAVERPRAPIDMMNRQASFRHCNKLADNSPFKKQYSLRLNELPSNMARHQLLDGMGRSLDSASGGVDVIHEVSPSKEQGDISDLCHQIETFSSNMETEEAPATKVLFVQPKNPTAFPFGVQAHKVQLHTPASSVGAPVTSTAVPSSSVVNSSQKAPQQPHSAASYIPTPASNTPAGAQPIRQTNPWETPPAFRHENIRHASPAESWLQSTVMSSSTTPPIVPPSPQAPFGDVSTAGGVQSGVVGGSVNGYPQTPPPVAQRTRVPPIGATPRANTVDGSGNAAHWFTQQKAPTLRELRINSQLSNFASTGTSGTPLVSQAQQNGGVNSMMSSPWGTPQPPGPTSNDPFDAAWATKSPNTKPASSNPFQSADGDNSAVTQTFKVQI